MLRAVVVKRELSVKAKFLIYHSMYVLTLNYGHELWVMTEKEWDHEALSDWRNFFIVLRTVGGTTTFYCVHTASTGNGHSS